MTSARRRLDSPDAAQDFLVSTLGYPNNKQTMNLAFQIFEREVIDRALYDWNTLHSDSYRAPNVRKHGDREALREKIIHELFTMKRPTKDKDIRLGFGGSLPQTKLKKKGECFIVLGPPASGKSGVSNKISDHFGAIIIDPDHAKQKLPEFHSGRLAGLVHEESSAIVNPLLGRSDRMTGVTSLTERAIEDRCNLVIPKIGDNQQKVERLVDAMIAGASYKVSLVLVEVERAEATRRALTRYIKDKRYVPLSYVFDEVSAQPQATFNNIVNNGSKGRLYRYAQYHNNVPIGSTPKRERCKNWKCVI